MAISLRDAAALLSTYLSVLLRAEIVIPVPPEGDGDSDTPLLSPLAHYFLRYMPQVTQRAKVEVETDRFPLPMVAQSKGTTLSAHVAMVVNERLREAAGEIKNSVDFMVPTFFYGDGSTQVIAFSPADLHAAVFLIANYPEVHDFVDRSLIMLKGAAHAS